MKTTELVFAIDDICLATNCCERSSAVKLITNINPKPTAVFALLARDEKPFSKNLYID